MVLQKEILYAMLGHTGQVVVTEAEEDGGKSFVLARGLPLIDGRGSLPAGLGPVPARGAGAAPSVLSLATTSACWTSTGSVQPPPPPRAVDFAPKLRGRLHVSETGLEAIGKRDVRVRTASTSGAG